MIVIAHNIRSMHNVGAILRNAAGFGVERVYFTGITATPPRKEIQKVSLGAEDLVPWESRNIDEILDELKREGWVLCGLETGTNAVSIHDVTIEQRVRLALVLGNEVDGIDEETVCKLDFLVEIPMHKKRSLNVSVASGIAMFALS